MYRSVILFEKEEEEEEEEEEVVEGKSVPKTMDCALREMRRWQRQRPATPTTR